MYISIFFSFLCFYVTRIVSSLSLKLLITTLIICCQWWRHQIYTAQKDSQSSKKQTNKYFYKYYSVRLKSRNHVGLQGMPGVGVWGWSCNQGRKTLTRLECPRQGTKHTKHRALQSLSKHMTRVCGRKNNRRYRRQMNSKRSLCHVAERTISWPREDIWP